MDAVVKWRVSPNVDTLVAAVVECKKLLVEFVEQMHGSQHTNVVSCDAYAGSKVLELFQLSELWTPCVDPEEKSVSRLVASFPLFKLHRLETMGEDQVRVVLVADVGEGHDLTYYGNVELVTR
jgi:hypothetical protein